MNVVVVGTGYVGLVTGTCLAQIGHNVTCVDIDESKIEGLKVGKVPIYEPGLGELVTSNSSEGRLRFSTNLAEQLSDADIVFIAVGTPADAYGRAEMKYVWKVAETLGEHMTSSLVIANKSTVPVGTARRIEEIIRQTYHGSFDVVSCPEFLREGAAVKDFMNPDRIVVGARSETARKIMRELFAPLNADIMDCQVESAEMIKYASNAFLATKISFINEIANICEKVGADVEEVSEGMGKDTRIGPKFLRAGLGYGGSCFPKDVRALDSISGINGYHFRLLKAVIEVNNYQRSVMADKIETTLGGLDGKTISVFGLAFKNNTDDVRDSASLDLIRYFLKGGAKVRATDPKAIETAREELGDSIEYFEDPLEAAKGADAVVVATEWDEYKNLPFDSLKEALKNPVIFDGRNIVNLQDAARNGFSIVSIGRRPTYL